MKEPERTLVILTPGFPDSEADTTCLPLQQRFVLALRKNFPDVGIIVLAFQYPYRKDIYYWNGIPVIPFSGRNKGGLSRQLLRKKIARTLQEITKRHLVVGLLSFWYGECAWVGNNYAVKHRLKHYCWILGQDARLSNTYPERVKAPARSLIALSDFLQDECERNHGIRPKKVIPAGIDVTQFCKIQRERDIDLLGVGSLVSLKQFHLFVEMIAALKQKLPGIKALLVGEGPERENLYLLIGRLGLEANIELAGELPHPEVLQLMQRSKILLHPSSYEGFSGVCLEALYAGAHVISFCWAMKKEIAHWHLITEKEALVKTSFSILSDPGTVYRPVCPYTLDEIAIKMMLCFTGPG